MITTIFIILRDLTFNSALASINQISEHNREDRLCLRKVNWSFLFSSQREYYYDIF